MCHGLCFSKVFKQQFSLRFARKFKFKFNLKDFPCVTVYVLVRYLSENFPCASRESFSLSLITKIFRVSLFMF